MSDLKTGNSPQVQATTQIHKPLKSENEAGVSQEKKASDTFQISYEKNGLKLYNSSPKEIHEIKNELGREAQKINQELGPLKDKENNGTLNKDEASKKSELQLKSLTLRLAIWKINNRNDLAIYFALKKSIKESVSAIDQNSEIRKIAEKILSTNDDDDEGMKKTSKSMHDLANKMVKLEYSKSGTSWDNASKKTAMEQFGYGNDAKQLKSTKFVFDPPATATEVPKQIVESAGCRCNKNNIQVQLDTNVNLFVQTGIKVEVIGDISSDKLKRIEDFVNKAYSRNPSLVSVKIDMEKGEVVLTGPSTSSMRSKGSAKEIMDSLPMRPLLQRDYAHINIQTFDGSKENETKLHQIMDINANGRKYDDKDSDHSGVNQRKTLLENSYKDYAKYALENAKDLLTPEQTKELENWLQRQ
jgi:hypothetical protein